MIERSIQEPVLKNLVLSLAILGGALLFPGSAAFAGLIDVQFSASSPSRQQSGAAVIGAAGDYWNSFAGASGAGNLMSTGRAATGVSLAFAANGAYTADPAFTAFTGTPFANLMQGILHTKGSGINIMLKGLSAGQNYSLYVYTQGDNNSARRSSAVTVNGVTKTSTQTNTNAFIEGNNYLVFSGIADLSGNLAIGVSNRNGEANVNGFQLRTVDVPEPASLALLGAGLVSLAFITRGRVAASLAAKSLG